MLLLGVDIAKLNHVASLVDSSSGEFIFSNFKFQNNILGFSSLLEKISNFSINEIVIGLESTGHYGENFINFFFQKDFKIAVINPLQTSHLRKASIKILKMMITILLTLLKLYCLENIDILLKKFY